MEGSIKSKEQTYGPKQILVAKDNSLCEFQIDANTTIYIFGGEAFQEMRFIEWSFVATNKDLIEKTTVKVPLSAPKPRSNKNNSTLMKIAIATIGKQKYKTEIQARNHIVMADEPLEVGGQDLGFTPTELLESSLAACSTMTIRMYADMKGWDLVKVEIKVGFKRNINTNQIIFEKEIQLYGNLDNEQREKLLEMGSKCPIEKMITGNFLVESKLM